MHPAQGNDVEDLLKFADNTMYQAKGSGKNNYVVYDNFMKETFSERLIIEKNLSTALEKNEFELYYQPQLDYHFGFEEKLMAKYGFKEFESHRLEHVFMVKKLHRLEKKILNQIRKEQQRI